MNQPDPLLNLREDDPAVFIAVDGDLLDLQLVKDEDIEAAEAPELEDAHV